MNPKVLNKVIKITTGNLNRFIKIMRNNDAVEASIQIGIVLSDNLTPEEFMLFSLDMDSYVLQAFNHVYELVDLGTKENEEIWFNFRFSKN